MHALPIAPKVSEEPLPPIPEDKQDQPTPNWRASTVPKEAHPMHARAMVRRIEGPDSLDDKLDVITGFATRCYAPFELLAPRADFGPALMTIDTRADGTIKEATFEPSSVSSLVAACLTSHLAPVPLHADKKPTHVVLELRIWSAYF